MPSLEVNAPAITLGGADQILRPPRPGLGSLRGEDVELQTLDGGDLGLR